MQIEMITEKLSNGTISYFQVYSKKFPLNLPHLPAGNSEACHCHCHAFQLSPWPTNDFLINKKMRCFIMYFQDVSGQKCTFDLCPSPLPSLILTSFVYIDGLFFFLRLFYALFCFVFFFFARSPQILIKPFFNLISSRLGWE